MTVTATQRFARDRPCPVCGGHDRLPRGHGERCHGFVSSDGRYAHCSREQHAGGLPLEQGSGTYAHKLDGECRCGQTHGEAAGRRPSIAPAPRAPIVAAYDYEDRFGALLFQVLRSVDKTFSQRRPDGRGGWIWNIEGLTPVLYRLPQLLAADPGEWVFCVEGEKDVDNLRAIGLVATCNPMGAKKWKPGYTGALRGRRVAIVPDNDEDGRAHADLIARSLQGVAASIKVVEL